MIVVAVVVTVAVVITVTVISISLLGASVSFYRPTFPGAFLVSLGSSKVSP